MEKKLVWGESSMKKFVAFLCIVAMLTGSLAGCNNGRDKQPAPANTPAATAPAMPENKLPDPDDGVVTDDDGIMTADEKPKS